MKEMVEYLTWRISDFSARIVEILFNLGINKDEKNKESREKNKKRNAECIFKKAGCGHQLAGRRVELKSKFLAYL